MDIHFKPDRSQSSHSHQKERTPQKPEKIKGIAVTSPQKEKAVLKDKSFSQNRQMNKNVALILLDRLQPHPIAQKNREPLIPLQQRIHQQMLPIIDLVEINQLYEIEPLKIDLTKLLKPELKGIYKPQAVTYNLSHLGIERNIHIIGNKYIPLKKSEHETVLQIFRTYGHQLGINSQELTLIVIEDAIFEKVMEEFAHHSVMLTHVPLAPQEKISTKEKEGAILPRHRPIATKGNKSGISWKKEVSKLMTQLVAQTVVRNERDNQKREQKLLREEQVIKYAIEQYERLRELVIKESEKKELTQERWNRLVEKWIESFPPFPIRAVNESVLWRELKPQMIEELLRHWRQLNVQDW